MIKLKYFIQVSFIVAMLNLSLVPIFPRMAAFFGYIMIVSFWFYAFVGSFTNRQTKRIIIPLFIIIIISAIISFHNFCDEELRQKLITVISFVAYYAALPFPNHVDNWGSVEFKIVQCFAAIMTVVFAVYAFVFPSIAYTPMGEYGNLVFTMGMGNPNGTAVCVLFVVMILLLSFVSIKKIFCKLVILVSIGVLAYILYLLSSRTVFACFIFAVLCTFLIPLLKPNRFFRYIALFAPIIMILLQFFLNEKIGNIQIFGKKLDTGRFEMYQELLQQMDNEPLSSIFGNIFKYNFENFHNGVLTVFASLGAVGVIWLLRTWSMMLRRIEKKAEKKHQRLAYFFILIFLFDAVAESMTVVGTIPYGVFVCLMFKIARCDSLVEDKNALG